MKEINQDVRHRQRFLWSAEPLQGKSLDVTLQANAKLADNRQPVSTAGSTQTDQGFIQKAKKNRTKNLNR